MNSAPDEFLPTRQSLLERLKNLDDQASWRTFFDQYWKLIYSVARKSGLSDAEAQDVVQETILSVTKSIHRFTYDPAYGSFKGWLKRLAQWRIGDCIRRRQYQVQGRRLPREEELSTSISEGLEDPTMSSVEYAWDEEWKNHVFELASEKVKQRVRPAVYQMFYFHVCKRMPAKTVASRLGVKLTEVYLAKYKVSALVKKEIKALEKSSVAT